MTDATQRPTTSTDACTACQHFADSRLSRDEYGRERAPDVDCAACNGDLKQIPWGDQERRDIRCTDCGAGGAITAAGTRVGPVFDTAERTTATRGVIA